MGRVGKTGEQVGRASGAGRLWGQAGWKVRGYTCRYTWSLPIPFPQPCAACSRASRLESAVPEPIVKDDGRPRRHVGHGGARRVRLAHLLCASVGRRQVPGGRGEAEAEGDSRSTDIRSVAKGKEGVRGRRKWVCVCMGGGGVSASICSGESVQRHC
eukprot:6213864-Pleurochrysis_carterae.AAC.2